MKMAKKFHHKSFGTLPNLSPPLLFRELPDIEIFILELFDVFVLPFVEIMTERAETISLSLKTRRITRKSFRRFHFKSYSSAMTV